MELDLELLLELELPLELELLPELEPPPEPLPAGMRAKVELRGIMRVKSRKRTTNIHAKLALRLRLVFLLMPLFYHKNYL